MMPRTVGCWIQRRTEQQKPGPEDALGDFAPLFHGGRYRIRTYDFHRVKMALYR